MSTRQIIRFGPNGELFGVLHSPASGNSVGANHRVRPGLAMCAPFGEEAKSAYRVFFDLACALADKGWTVLRFDYFGTGNSMGGFDGFAPGRARDDIGHALDLLREEGVGKAGLLGLGLGAALAFEAAPVQQAEFLILWQPTVNGEEFYKLNVKQAIFRQKLIRSKSSPSPDLERGQGVRNSPSDPAQGARRDGDIIDLDGYPLRKQTAEEIRAINLIKTITPAIPPTFIVQISFSQNLARDIKALADACQPKPHTQCVVCEPFWKRIGLVDAAPVTAATLNWLEDVVKS